MPKITTDAKKIEELLSRAVNQILPSTADLRKALMSGRQLRVKFGIDPTGINIHIGRAVVLWKLRQFQDLGHKLVLIVGDFTAQVGDPSDKLEKRPFLSKELVQSNLKNYIPQINKILDVKKAEVHYNSEWLAGMNLHEVSHLAEQFTYQQMMQRRNFKERSKSGEDISLRELFYPLMQGYDSVAVKADVELGGTDQLFNLLAGRKIQERYKQKPQIVMTTKMLVGLDGRKMSTSWGNVININDSPEEQYGKVMSMHDESLMEYIDLATGLPDTEVAKLIAQFKDGTNPKLIKERVGFEIVRRYYGEKSAIAAQKNFSKTFTKKETPDDIPTIPLQKFVSAPGFFADKLYTIGLFPSKSEARRKLQEGAVRINKKKIEFTRQSLVIDLKSGDIIQVGKRRFVKIQ